MKSSKVIFSNLWLLVAFLWTLLLCPGSLGAQALIIDHNCADLSQIPDYWINQAKMMFRMHYAHTSHGDQLIIGLKRLNNLDIRYAMERGRCSLPLQSGMLPGKFTILDGQPLPSCDSYVPLDLYWETPEGVWRTQDTLDHFNVNLSTWAWCRQLDYFSANDVQRYLDTMSSLEAANPDIQFIYMTGNAQAEGKAGYNRYLRNQQIRDFCRENGKILFDFGDLDCWYNNELHTYSYDGHIVPSEHPRYRGDDAAYTTYQSCEQKGRALWWMLARLAGWSGPRTDPNCTGWWYTPGEEGTGLSIEVQGDSLFLAWYTFNEQGGQSIWHTSGGKMTDQYSYSGDLLQWYGWPLGSPQFPARSVKVGTIQINFTSTNEALLSCMVEGRQDEKIICKFMNFTSPGIRDIRDIHGWWYDPDLDGMGVFIEAQGNGLFMAWYHYREDGSSRWWTSGGYFPNGSTAYTGDFVEWMDGQCIACPSYKEAQFVPESQQPVVIRFYGDSQAILTWNGGTLNLERFSFGSIP